MKPIHMALALFVAFLWGAQVIAVKIGGIDMPPIFMLAMRFAIIAVALLPFVGIPKREHLWPIYIISGLMSVLHFAFLYSGIVSLKASTSGVLYQSTTPFAVLAAVIVLHERPPLKSIIGVAVAFGGVCVTLGGLDLSSDWSGALWLLLGAACFGLGSAVSKKLGGGIGALQINGWSAMFAAPQLLIVSLLFKEKVSFDTLQTVGASSWLAILYTALAGGLMGFFLWFWLLKRYSVSQLAPFNMLAPIFTVLLGVLVFGDSLSTTVIAGAAVTFAGVAICQIKLPQPTRFQRARSGV